MSTKPNTNKLCQLHNTLSIGHIASSIACDGFCYCGDPCVFIQNAISECNSCGTNACGSQTIPYFDGDNFIDENGDIVISP